MRTVGESVRERIRSDILRSGASISGSRVPSERELQERYGVSRRTINRALCELAADGLLVRPIGARRYSIAEHIHSAAPATRDAKFIGCVSSDLSSTHFGAQLGLRVFRGIHDAAIRRGARVLMGISGEDIASERGAVTHLIESGASGLVIWPHLRSGKDIEDDYLVTEVLPVPVVLLDNTSPAQGHIQVVFDNRRAGYDITSWLIEQGHRRIAIVTVPDESRHTPVLSRLQGYREALASHEIACDPHLIARLPFVVLASRYSDPAVLDDHINRMLDEWLGLQEAPTAIVGIEDSVAIDLITHLSDRGIRVPDEICVTGFDNLDIARLFRPGFTTTRPDFRRMGELACSLLLDRLAGVESPPMTYVLESPLIVRGRK